MLRALEGRYKEKKLISLEERMGCGIGACFACVCHLQEDPSDILTRRCVATDQYFQSGRLYYEQIAS